MDQFSRLCDPAKLYLVLTIIACVVALFQRMGVMAVIVKLLFALLWTWVLNWLCKKGYAMVSWALVLFPFIMILLAMMKKRMM